MLLIIAIVGTTVAPWQLFFQQSNVVDKRITAAVLGYERADTLLGTLVVVVGAVAVCCVCAFAFGGTPLHGHFTDAGAVAAACQHGRPLAGALFALLLLDASLHRRGRGHPGHLLRARRLLGFKHSLHRSLRDATVSTASTRARPRRRGDVVLDPGPARPDHHRRAGAGRDPAAQRHASSCCCCATTGRSSARGQSALAERDRRGRHRRARRPLGPADDHHALPDVDFVTVGGALLVDDDDRRSPLIAAGV